MVVSVDEMTAEIAVAGEMKLAHSGFRDGLQVGQRVEAVIDAADVDIVDVEQDGAIRALRDLAQEFPFAHLGGVEGQIARDVLQQDLPPEGVLHLTDSRHDRSERLLRVGQGQEIVQVASVDPGPAQMIGNPMRFDACRKRANSGEIVEVDGIGAADRQRHAVHDQREALANALQVVERLAAGDEIVFGDDFEPVDGVRLVEDGLIVRSSQAETESRRVS